jgi:hypothetical protein
MRTLASYRTEHIHGLNWDCRGGCVQAGTEAGQHLAFEACPTPAQFPD